MPASKFPDWFDEAVMLRAEGHNPRQIASILKERGYKVNHTSVWQHVTPGGRERLKTLRSEEGRKKRRLEARKRYKESRNVD